MRKISDAGREIVQTTHQKLSAEFGTAREIVWRLLQNFWKRGWIEQTREKINSPDTARLSEMAQKDA